MVKTWFCHSDGSGYVELQDSTSHWRVHLEFEHSDLSISLSVPESDNRGRYVDSNEIFDSLESSIRSAVESLGGDVDRPVFGCGDRCSWCRFDGKMSNHKFSDRRKFIQELFGKIWILLEPIWNSYEIRMD